MSDSFMNHFVNPVTRLLLRSPLHPLLSKNTLLLGYTGRQSGKAHTVPVNYVRDDGSLMVISNRDRRWGRNLRGGVRVTVRVQGRDFPALAEPLALDDQALAAALQRYYQRIASRQLSDSEAARRAANKVMIRVQMSIPVSTGR